MRNKILQIIIISLTTIFFGCMAGPNFKAPVVELPQKYAGSTLDSSINLEWWNIFQDSTLTRLITTALNNNKNLMTAISRVEQARFNMRATKADLFPSVGYSLKGSYGNESPLGKSPKNIQEYNAGATIGWELDFFGKIRRATESARAQLLATDYARQGVAIALITEVATTYFSLLSYEQALMFSEVTYDSRSESLQLIEASFAKGAVSDLDVQQARQLKASAAAAIPQYRRAYTQTKNTLYSLLGVTPGAPIIWAHYMLSNQRMPDQIPSGLPLELLQRRPDVMQSFYTVMSQNALIGVAQAMRFPTVSLTGDGGLISGDLSKLFQAKSFLWTAAGSMAGPVFQFGKNRRKVDIARAQKNDAVLAYEQTVIDAVVDVENSLIAVSTYNEQVVQYKAMLDASTKVRVLSTQRYLRGLSGFLEVLDADRTLFETEIEYYQILAAQLSSIASLYKSLGGGWILPPVAESETVIIVQ